MTEDFPVPRSPQRRTLLARMPLMKVLVFLMPSLLMASMPIRSS